MHRYLKYLPFVIFGALAIAAVCMLAACSNDAQIASYNLSQAADNFKISRRIVFYNGITNDYMLVIEGLCSQEQTDKKLSVTGADEYKKHFLGLSDNVSYISEQLEPAKVGVYSYRVTFKPTAIIPSIEVR
jgi:hypothetical protein